MKKSRQELDGRQAPVFALRMSESQRREMESVMERTGGPRSLGPWMIWRALSGPRGSAPVLPPRAAGKSRGTTPPGGRLPQIVGKTPPAPPIRRRVILDLCSGSGAWSEPYKRAGYRVERVTLPRRDVRTFNPKGLRVWGILAAPPCTEFSMARNGSRGAKVRDYVEGMACVNAIYRIVMQCRPQWWALENPVGMLSTFLGTPRDVFEPCDYGDPWTKRTALWGDFTAPKRGPFVRPATGKTRLDRSPEERAVTPPGFARAFFEANP